MTEPAFKKVLYKNGSNELDKKYSLILVKA